VKASYRLVSAACSRQNGAKAGTHLRSSVRHSAYHGANCEASSCARWVMKKDMARGAALATGVGPNVLVFLFLNELH